MRIAIVGAGISGLTVAHLLDPVHDVTVFEAAGYAGGHTNTVRVDTAARDAPGRHRLHRLQRPQLPATSSGCCDRLGVASQPSTMSFSVQRRPRRLRVQRLLAQRPVRQARAPGHAVVPADDRRPGRASIAPPARCCATAAASGPSLGALAGAAALLATVHRTADRPPGRRRCGRPIPRRCGRFPARFLAEFFDNHGMLGAPRPAALADGQRRLGALRRGAHGAGLRGRDPAEHARSQRSPARDDHVLVTPRGGEPERFDEVVLATHSDQALALLGDATRPRARAARRAPLPAQRGGAAHRRARCCRAAGAPGRAGTTTCSTHPGRRTTVTYHMNRLQSLRAEREFCVTLNRTEAIDPPTRDPHDRLRPPGVHTRPASRAQRARGGDQRPQPHALLRRLLGLGLSRGRRRQRAARRRALRGDA